MQVIVFDTETTDLIQNSLLPLNQQPRIIEIFARKIQLPKEAWGKMDEWQLVGEFDTLINPEIKIPPEIVNITSINDEMVFGAPKARDIWPALALFFSTADIVVAHNLNYDMAVVNFEQMRIDPDKKFPWPRQKVCTVEATEHLKGHRLKLIALHEHLFGCEFKGAHRAKADVDALELCYKKLHEIGEL